MDFFHWLGIVVSLLGIGYLVSSFYWWYRKGVEPVRKKVLNGSCFLFGGLILLVCGCKLQYFASKGYIVFLICYGIERVLVLYWVLYGYGIIFGMALLSYLLNYYSLGRNVKEAEKKVNEDMLKHYNQILNSKLYRKLWLRVVVLLLICSFAFFSVWAYFR
jgi:hypothetical protein